MAQSTLHPRQVSGLHVAIVMDGNGRWASRRGRPRASGHREGARTARRIVEAAPDLGIDVLTLYAFSSDNWRRPEQEVRSLMRLFTSYLRREAGSCAREGVRVRVIGRRDRLPLTLLDAINTAETLTEDCRNLTVRIALDYSSRESILLTAARLGSAGPPTRERFAEVLGEVNHNGAAAPEVDLLVRTGGERRLSDFLLWECAYAELWFSDVMWPDFGPDHLARAVEDFRGRERRFGGLGALDGEPGDVQPLAS